MPNVTKFRSRPIAENPQFLFDVRRPMVAANSAMIEQVITHADQVTRMAGGKMKLRVSAAMIESLQAQGRLGDDAWRLADLTVVWDEAEGQVATVRDDARLREAAQRWSAWDALDEFWDERAEPAAAFHSAAA